MAPKRVYIVILLKITPQLTRELTVDADSLNYTALVNHALHHPG